MAYYNSVFINCPFDNKYRKLLERLIFILSFYKFKVQISSTYNSAADRMDNICNYINNSKYTIHDLSRHKSSKRGEYSRFNMPFEFGIDFSLFHFENTRRTKVIAVLDTEPHDYDRYISDLSGRDILYHQNDPNNLFSIIPEWLSANTGKVYDAPRTLSSYHAAWISDYKIELKRRGNHDLRTLPNISLTTYQILLKEWIPNWKVANNYTDPY